MSLLDLQPSVTFFVTLRPWRLPKITRAPRTSPESLARWLAAVDRERQRQKNENDPSRQVITLFNQDVTHGQIEELADYIHRALLRKQQRCGGKLGFH